MSARFQPAPTTGRFRPSQALARRELADEVFGVVHRFFWHYDWLAPPEPWLSPTTTIRVHRVDAEPVRRIRFRPASTAHPIGHDRTARPRRCPALPRTTPLRSSQRSYRFRRAHPR